MTGRTAVYRAPMRSRELEVAPGAGAEFGVRTGVVGIGPGRGDKAARMVDAFARVPEGSFVWTRDSAGAYRLGRIAGEMREVDSAAARAVGIGFVRAADWHERAFTEEEIPPAVARTFARGGRNFQRTRDAAAEELTERLWRSRGC